MVSLDRRVIGNYMAPRALFHPGDEPYYGDLTAW